MEPASALAALEASLKRPSCTPCTWADDRDAYLREQKQLLLAALVEPLVVCAVAGDWAQRYTGADAEVREFVAVARSEDTWLLYSPQSGEFAKAFGSAHLQPLNLLGFSSDDALAEWLG